ncbi:DNA (cytosine-5)-methyltransferase 3C-like isoform X2 [Styela clava]|uniref:DNA (cytosine-5)-methyltransferase 3C-like isoform X2 n=1 Tax=Styela clava TaxID=7725 RepID=UPI00193A471F|nr:DNA (cytosine-5)-methyltransferase 3C-like isoform X2 [Styela clava]
MTNSKMRHHISSKNAKRRKWEDDTYDSCSSESDISDDMYAKKKSGLKYQVPCWSEDTEEESSEEKDDCIIISCSEKENSDEDSSPNEQDTTKLLTPGRADLGLRKKIKPVERFQAGMFKSKKKKKAKFTRREVSESSSCEVSSDEESLASNSDNSKENQMEDRDEMNFKKVMNGTMKIEDICLACGTTEEIVAKHPLFIGGLCKEHEELFHEWFFKYDSDGYHSCCSVCCMGSKLVLCDIKDCLRCYCKNCLDSLVHQGRFDEAVQSKHWVCDFCKESEEGVLKKRPEWQHEIQRLYQCKTESKFPPFQVPPPMPVQSRRPIRVLSLFDGIATGIVALKQLGLEIGKFVASEINEDAIRLVQNKHPEVVHVGDITKLTDDEIYKMGPFDLLLGGSPCNDLSGANPRRRGLLDAEGSGCLFFDFYRVLRTVEPPRSQQKIPFFWLFENVVSMKGIEKQRISRFLQCEAKMADARNVSAAARPRLFWGNIPGLKDRKITPGINDKLTVQECLESGRTAMVKQLNTITTKYTCLYQGQARQAPVKHGDKEDVLWTTEVERIFGVPEHYTDVNNLGPRERLTLLGRSWSVPVVRLLLSPLKEYFSGVKVENNPSCSWWR